MRCNVWQLLKLKLGKLTMPKKSTQFELAWSHCLSPRQLFAARNAERADEKPFEMLLNECCSHPNTDNGAKRTVPVILALLCPCLNNNTKLLQA